MADNRHESNLPRELAAPARRALLGAGCTRLEDVAKMSEAEVMALHGIGPNAMKQLRRAPDRRASPASSLGKAASRPLLITGRDRLLELHPDLDTALAASS